jgi:hypothetical protein
MTPSDLSQVLVTGVVTFLCFRVRILGLHTDRDQLLPNPYIPLMIIFRSRVTLHKLFRVQIL